MDAPFQPLLDNVLVEDVAPPEFFPGTEIMVPARSRDFKTHGTVKRGVILAVGPGKFPDSTEEASPFIGRLPMSPRLQPGVHVRFKGYGVECHEGDRKMRVISESDILAIEV